MTDRQAEQATAEEVRALVMAGVRAGADLRPAALAACGCWNYQHLGHCIHAAFERAAFDGSACPGCGRGAGLWCAPWCEYADPGEPCPDCSAAGDCHPWCPRREVAP